MVEEHVQGLLPAYALGCLDEQELLQVARHLPRCALCRAELETYWATAEQLAFAVPAMVPPPQLKSKIMARVGQQAARVGQQAERVDTQAARAVPAGSRAGQSGGTVGGWLAALFGPSRPANLGWAVALLLVLGLATSNLLLWGQVNALQARVPDGDMQIVSLLGTPNAPSAQGYLMIFENETYGTLVVENAPPLDPGLQYQLWLIRDGKRTSGGVFSVTEEGYAALQIDANQPLKTYPSFGVTVEPYGGSPGPTGQKVMGGDL